MPIPLLPVASLALQGYSLFNQNEERKKQEEYAKKEQEKAEREAKRQALARALKSDADLSKYSKPSAPYNSDSMTKAGYAQLGSSLLNYLMANPLSFGSGSVPNSNLSLNTLVPKNGTILT